jgi:hypothetical protein
VEPAPDLLDAEQKWRDAVREVNVLRKQLRVLPPSSGSPASG